MEPHPEPPEERLSAFAADALDWPAVRALLVPYAPTALGRRALEELGPRPPDDAADALARAHELLALAEEEETPPLEGGVDPLPALRAAVRYGRTLAPEDLLELARTLRRVEEVGHWLAGRRQRAPRSAALWTGLPDLAALRAELEAKIDRRGRVSDDATPRLRSLRTAIEELTREVDRVVRELAGRPALRPAFAEGHAGRVHRRGGRRVLAVRERHAGRVPGIVHDRSASGGTVFVEPREAVEVANRLSGVESDARQEEQRLLAELTRDVVQRRDSIELVCGRLAELELAVLSVRWARAVGGRPARLPGEPGAAPRGLVLRGWRHPLLIEEARAGRIPEVVPIDLRLGGAFDLLVVTGPNTGGKTLALKGAGLAALMTRMGLALPCDEGTTVPLYDGVAADIGDEQEVQQNLSTFSSHLLRIRAGLERAGPTTLVLLDELGGGTDPMEGAALGEALLERLLADAVPTLASTHLGKLKEFGFRNERAENAHVEFDLETLAPRFSLVIGAPGESRALAIARRLGLPDELVERAAERIEPEPGEAARLMEQMRGVRVETERLRAEAEQRTVELEERVRAAEGERERLEGRREHVEAEAQRGLEERFTAARTRLQRARSLLDQVESRARAALAAVLDELEEALGGALLTERRADFLARLKKGATVWLPRFKKRCEVTRVYKERRELEVRLGKRSMTVGFDDVTFYESL